MVAEITLDFRQVADHRQHPSGINRDKPNKDSRPQTAEGKLLTKKQIRARARRAAKRMNNKKPIMSEAEFNHLYKPVEEWDLEELARGRPRGADGKFSGPRPQWITRQVHEKAMEQFQLMVKTEMGAQTVDALSTLRYLMIEDSEDKRGRPMVPPSVKAQVAQFLVEHVVGKPKQRMETDISVKLQALLGTVLVNPNQALAPGDQGGMSPSGLPSYTVAHLPGHTIPMGSEQVNAADDEDIIDLDEEDIDDPDAA